MECSELFRYAKAKGRNICYYYSLDVQDIESGRSERCQYMHILRDYKKQLQELLRTEYLNQEQLDWISKVCSIIPDNVKKKTKKNNQELSCNHVIRNLSDFIYGKDKLIIRDNTKDRLQDISDYKTRAKSY